MAGRNVSLGDRHEARQPRLRGEEIVTARVERALGDEIADREQLAVVVEQKAELHCERCRPRGLLQGREARRRRGGCLRRPVEITAVALDRSSGRLRPEQHVGAGVVASFARERKSDVRQGLRVDRERRETFRDPLAVDECPSQVGRQHGERLVQLAPRHRLRSPTFAQPARLFAHELERVCDTGKTALVGERLSRPFPARIGESDEVPGQISAIDGGDISGIERPQIPRVVPVVEMAAEAREPVHGGQGRLQPLDRIDRSRPSEVAGAHHR